MRRLAPGVLGLLAVASALASIAGAAPSARVVLAFRSPSGNIGCWTYLPTKPDGRAFVCKIVDQTVRKTCGYGFAAGWRAPSRTAALPQDRPTGDCTMRPEVGYQSVDFSRAPVLAYGRSKTIGAIVCRSAAKGVTCTNRAGHGLFLSRGSIRLF